MKTPNLFDFAYSELSQDAFLCWLLSWAKEEYATADTSLHQCARRFIAALFEKHGLSAPAPISKIEIKQQHKKIDVFCVINDEYAIIIEDKTDTKNHSQQLVRYRDDIKTEGYPDKKILGIYYKTEDQGDRYKEVKDGNFEPFLRRDMLQVLNGYTGKSEILLSYRARLQVISDEVESYKTSPLDGWPWRAWMGFYLALQTALKESTWDYVPNQSGGFLGLWWSWHGDDECEQYLQLEQKTEQVQQTDQKDKKEKRHGVLCFKIDVKDKPRYGELRDKWRKAIADQSENHPMLVLDKPSRFGFGKTMTVCIHKGDYRVVGAENKIDMEKTLALLKSAEQALAAAQGSVK